MKIKKLIVGQLQTNCYLVWDEKSRQTVIIDPGDDADFIANKIRDHHLQPMAIAVTHGHFDHVLAVPELKLAFNLPFLLHQKDLFLLKRSAETAHYFTGAKGDPPLRPDRFVKEGDQIKFGKEKLTVAETPGHSPGGVVFYSRGEGVLFSGDTLFCQAVGRTDFSYGSGQDLKNSIEKLFNFPGKTAVYPGHGVKTKIGKEKIYFAQGEFFP